MLDNNCSNFVSTSQAGYRASQKPQQQAFQRRRKAQIISIPGIAAKEKFRYRVVLDGRILGDRLSLEQALEKAGLSAKGVNL